MKFSIFQNYFFVTILLCGVSFFEVQCSVGLTEKVVSEIVEKFGGNEEKKKEEFGKCVRSWVNKVKDEKITFYNRPEPVNILNKLNKTNDIKATIETIKVD